MTRDALPPAPPVSASAKGLTRRAVAVGLIAAPAVLRAHDALATSGFVRVYAWRDYLSRTLIDQFEADSGVRVSLGSYRSNDEAETLLRDSGGRGYDVVFPSMTNVANYDDPDAPGGSLLRPLDERALRLSAIDPAFMRQADAAGARGSAGLRLAPFAWGTEGVTLNRNIHGLSDREVSYANLWRPEVGERATLRPSSGLIGAGLYLDSLGVVRSDRMRSPNQSPEEARRVYGAVARWMEDRRANLGALWNDFTEAHDAFTERGCTIGQTWDLVGLALNRSDANIVYRAPREGMLGWMDGVGMMATAQNIEQSHAFINFLLTPEAAALFAASTGYNAAASGAVDALPPLMRRQYLDVYNTEVIANIWWWGAEPAFAPSIRNEVAGRITL